MFLPGRRALTSWAYVQHRSWSCTGILGEEGPIKDVLAGVEISEHIGYVFRLEGSWWQLQLPHSVRKNTVVLRSLMSLKFYTHTSAEVSCYPEAK